MWAAALAHFDLERAQRAADPLVPDGEGETPAVIPQRVFSVANDVVVT
jgi:hypothetical protein